LFGVVGSVIEPVMRHGRFGQVPDRALP